MILKMGDSGTQVLDIQNKLRYIGYDIEPDGAFGPKTNHAVLDFQQTHGLKVDGIVGENTMDAISQSYKKQMKYESAGNYREEKGTLVVDFKTGPIFLLDNGHGGIIDGVYQTAGKRSPEIPPGVYEGVANRNIVNRIIDYCEDNKISYANLVTENEDVSLSERVRRANNIHSRYRNCIYVSVHCNAAGNGKWNSANGIETFYRTPSNKKIADAIQVSLIDETDARNRGVKKGNFFVLRKTTMPAVLTECGFMTNKNEAQLLASEDYVDKLAFAIARAFKRLSKI